VPNHSDLLTNANRDYKFYTDNYTAIINSLTYRPK
jgi:hypothetical protein